MQNNRLVHVYTIFPALALALASGPVLARSAYLVEPPTVTTQCDLSDADMTDAIVTGGSVRGWRPVTRTPGVVELRYVKGADKHSLTVDVEYTRNTFTVFYKDSTNLDYKVKKNGVRVIHPRPNGWMSNLSMDIESQTFIHCAK